MTEPEMAPRSMGLEELLAYREATERVSTYLGKRLKDHLSALAPLLVPGRVLGKHVGSRDAAPRADEALAELAEKYKQVSTAYPGLKPELDEEALTSIAATVQIHPYEYSYDARGTKASRQIAMTSPVRWVAAYGSGGSLSQIRTQMLSANDRRSAPVRQFVLNALAFQVILGRSPAAQLLIRDLRYQIETSTLAGLEGFPLLIFGVEVPSFRPPDDLLLTATRLSGVPAFIEMIEPEAVRCLQDPLRVQIEALLQERE